MLELCHGCPNLLTTDKKGKCDANRIICSYSNARSVIQYSVFTLHGLQDSKLYPNSLASRLWLQWILLHCPLRAMFISGLNTSPSQWILLLSVNLETKTSFIVERPLSLFLAAISSIKLNSMRKRSPYGLSPLPRSSFGMQWVWRVSFGEKSWVVKHEFSDIVMDVLETRNASVYMSFKKC